MRVSIRIEAQEEARHHVAWYAERDERVARRLSNLFVSTIKQIAREPTRFPRLEYSGNKRNIRRARLGKFPLVILFEIFNDEAEVFAVIHASQRPGYWGTRIGLE